MIIALVGSPLSGKTTILKELHRNGIKIFSADSFVLKMYKHGEDGYNIIKKEVGPEFVNNIDVDKKELAKWASDDENLKRLNELIHPLIFDYLEGKDNYVAEMPALTSSHIRFKYDKIILIKASPKVISERFSKRKIMNPDFIKKLIKDWETDIPFDYVIDTTNNIKEDDISNIIKLING